ncbi:MAG: TetR/AcrR family transcriptional regulator [Acidimicrobiales bacterium]
MPKLVDHQDRRRHIAEALWRVTVAHGLEGVSLRHVAVEAQVSMGLVQHYFTSKDEMLLFSLDALHERVSERIARRVASAVEPLVPQELVRAVLIEMLPLDEQRRMEAQVGLAFMAQAAVHPALAAAFRAEFDQLQQFMTEQIAGARQVDNASYCQKPESAAAELLALLDGLTAHILAGCRAPDTAVELFDRRLSAVLPTLNK